MPLEIEAKFKVDSHAPFAERLKTLGARHQEWLTQTDQFFDRTDRSLLAKDCGLRLRREKGQRTDRSQICFKGPRDQNTFKQREEIEFDVSDGHLARCLLEALGFEATLIVEKKRSLWKLDQCLVCLDEVTELGCFVEIEGADEIQISSVAAKLGLGDHKHIPQSYVKMLALKKNLR